MSHDFCHLCNFSYKTERSYSNPKGSFPKPHQIVLVPKPNQTTTESAVKFDNGQ